MRAGARVPAGSSRDACPQVEPAIKLCGQECPRSKRASKNACPPVVCGDRVVIPVKRSGAAALGGAGCVRCG